MGIGQIYLDLQELDLSLMRDAKTLNELPEVRDLAKKRRAYLKLKADEKRLFAEGKDIRTDLSDLDTAERRCNYETEEAQRDTDTSDYRAVQDLEVRLSNIAKELDKIAFSRKEREQALAAHEAEEEKLAALIAKLEEAIKAATRTARERALDLQQAIERNKAAREKLVGCLTADELARYETAAKRFGGLAVEYLDGTVPSICRTGLQAAALDELRRAGEVGECPYCHRILVLKREEDA